MQYCAIHEQDYIEAWPDTLICDECYYLNMGGKEEDGKFVPDTTTLGCFMGTLLNTGKDLA